MAGLIDLSQIGLNPQGMNLQGFNGTMAKQPNVDTMSPDQIASVKMAPHGIGDMLKQWAPQMSQAGGMMGGQPTDFSDTEGLNNQLMQHMQALNASRMGRY